MVKKYIPKQEDVVLLDFNPTKGHKRSGYRLAIIISIITLLNACIEE